ncbi:MAG: 4-hydroxy-tetrahydrodipicolinate reductase [Dehalococcoidales bacterium]|nr:4-hydroxy-tetrahydrodipicolinate reductase [Dehalococcoidales bacterium]
MKPIRVVVHGAQGKMGREVIRAVWREPGMDLVGAIELNPADDSLSLPNSSTTVPFSSDLANILERCQPDVMIDFTTALATMSIARTATSRGVNLVIGTTGLTTKDINEIDHLATTNKVGAIIAPNFALGAILLIHLAKIAAKYFDHAEIIELHHHLKADAPSGTAIATAKAMAAARSKPFSRPPQLKNQSDSRGQQVEGITVHSVRLPGIVARQEILLGEVGQTLSLKHDAISRECYMPGVILATKEVIKLKGLVYGLDSLLEL